MLAYGILIRGGGPGYLKKSKPCTIKPKSIQLFKGQINKNIILLVKKKPNVTKKVHIVVSHCQLTCT